MRMQDINIYESYRLTNSKYWVKVLEKLAPNEWPNKNTYPIVKCIWSLEKNTDCGCIKYFRPSDLIKEKL